VTSLVLLAAGLVWPQSPAALHPRGTINVPSAALSIANVDGYWTAFDSTGKRLWSVDYPTDGAAPLIAATARRLIFEDHALGELRATDFSGREQWSFFLNSRCRGTSELMTEKGLLVSDRPSYANGDTQLLSSASFYAGLRAESSVELLDTWTGRTRWRISGAALLTPCTSIGTKYFLGIRVQDDYEFELHGAKPRFQLYVARLTNGHIISRCTVQQSKRKRVYALWGGLRKLRVNRAGVGDYVLAFGGNVTAELRHGQLAWAQSDGKANRRASRKAGI